MYYLSETHPSSIFLFCPHCGHNGFAFDGTKLFECLRCNFKYYINAATAVAAILEAFDGKIVLTRRKHDPRAGAFDLPGGFVDPMESVEDALKRELREELNLTIDSMQYLTSFANEYTYKGISYFTCDIAFVCHIHDFSAIKPSDDVSEAIFIDPKDIDFSTISFPSIINILKHYITTRH